MSKIVRLQGIGRVFRIVAMLSVLGLFALLTIRYSPFSPEKLPIGETHPAVGQRLERIELTPLLGAKEPVTASSLTGDVVLINLWGTWCPPCRQEFPHLMALVEKYANRPGFRFLSVSCSPGGETEDLDDLKASTEAFLARGGFSPPIYADPDRVTRGELDRVIGLEGYPTTVLVDRNRTVRAVWVGYWSGLDREVKTVLDKVLSEPASAGTTASAGNDEPTP